VEHVLSYIECLEKRAKAGELNLHSGIQTQLRRHGTKTMAIVPKQVPLLGGWRQWCYIPDSNGSILRTHGRSRGPICYTTGREKLRKLWEMTYKQDSALDRAENSPEPEPKSSSYLEDILDQVVPIARKPDLLATL
jgi:hypothetical protein